MNPDPPLITAPVEKFLRAAKIPVRMACTTESGWPFVLSLWYIYLDGCIYCATQSSALVVSYLQRNPACAFEIAGDLPPYCGVRGRAQAEILPERGLIILEKLLERYLQDIRNPLAVDLLSRQATEVAIRLEPLSLYTWNFTARMQASVPSPLEKPCPP